MTTKYTKRPYILPNIRKIFQMIIKYSNIFLFRGLPNFTEIGIFGWKTNHLATLICLQNAEFICSSYESKGPTLDIPFEVPLLSGKSPSFSFMASSLHSVPSSLLHSLFWLSSRLCLLCLPPEDQGPIL
jgi:hypothetical protein